jgi:hypothetical protein
MIFMLPHDSDWNHIRQLTGDNSWARHESAACRGCVDFSANPGVLSGERGLHHRRKGRGHCAGRESATATAHCQYAIAVKLCRETGNAQPVGHFVGYITAAREFVRRTGIVKHQPLGLQHPRQLFIERL